MRTWLSSREWLTAFASITGRRRFGTVNLKGPRQAAAHQPTQSADSQLPVPSHRRALEALALSTSKALDSRPRCNTEPPALLAAALLALSSGSVGIACLVWRAIATRRSRHKKFY